MLLGQSTEGLVLLCDRQGMIQQVLYDSLGISSQIELERPVTQLVDPNNMAKMLNLLVEVNNQSAIFDWEVNIPLRGRVIPIHFTGVAIDNNQILIIGAQTSRDVSQLYEEIMKINNEQLTQLRASLKKQARPSQKPTKSDSDLYDELTKINNELATVQRRLAKANIELEQLNAQKNRFLGMAAHDLRNPLGVTISFSEFLLEEATDVLSEEHVEFLTIIRNSSEFMLGLVNELLDVATIESGKLTLDMEPVDLSGLIENNIELNNVFAAKKQITLTFRQSNPVPTVMVDRHKIVQVLNNLVSNAIKFSHPNSQVEVTLAHNKEGQVEISVRDEGQGIPADELGRLFKPFAKTSVQSTSGEKSTGLGLMICRNIIEGHGGKIEVESSVGQGTTFYIKLPLEAGTAPPAPGTETDPPAQTPATTASAPLRILLADDSPMNQKVARQALKKLGYHQVETAASGSAVLAHLKQKPVDLILMDLHMAGMDGLEATRQIRQQWPQHQQPYIVAMTASTRPEDLAKCREAGMDHFINKPFDLPELEAVLKASQSQLPPPEQPAGPSPQSLTDDLPIIDTQKLTELKNILGPDALDHMVELIDLFFDNATKMLAKMQTAVQQQDATSLRLAAHTIKAGCGQLGAARLTRLCTQLESMGQDEQLEGATEKLIEFEKEYAEVKLILQNEFQM